MSDSGSFRDISVDLGNELLHVPSLWESFIEKTAFDSRKWLASRASAPPWWIFLGLVAATIFFGFLKSMIAFLAGFFALSVLIWIVFIRNSKNENSEESVLSGINNGIFPPEMRDSITRRLRWWDALIAPSEWTKNSKIFHVRDKLTTRVEDLDAEIVYWQSPKGSAVLNEQLESEEAAKIRFEEYQKKLRLLKSRGVNVREELSAEFVDKDSETSESYNDPENLVKLLRGKGECERQLLRISNINDPINRAMQEMVFAKALLIHCNKIIAMIDETESLGVAIESIKADNMNDKIKEIISVLERRRTIVGKLNRISPKRILSIVDYNPIQAQSEVSRERFINEK